MNAICRCLGPVIVAVTCAAPWSGHAATIAAPHGGTVRALLVGINDYVSVPKLSGAVADAQGMRDALASAGVPQPNLRLILDRAATRPRLLEEMTQLADSARPGDLVVLSFAGHGTRVSEMYPNTKPDHQDEAYVLAQFDRQLRAGEYDLIAGPEIKHWIGDLDQKGVDVLFIADTCFGGGLTRKPARRDTLNYREIDVSSHLQLKPSAAATPADAALQPTAFSHLTFVAAADPLRAVPEIPIEIDGQRRIRGALSYGMARAIGGAVKPTADGVVTRGALFEYLRQEVSHYRDDQVIETAPQQPDRLDAAVFRVAGDAVAPPAPPPAPSEGSPLSVAVEDGPAQALSGIGQRGYPFMVVPDYSSADIIWNAARREAFFSGDVGARHVGAQDIPAVVDRVWAGRRLALLADDRVQPFRIKPNHDLHPKGEEVSLEADGVSGKYLIALDVTGDGIVRYLFPRANETGVAGGEGWTIDNIQVADHFGSDLVVLVVSPTRLTDLEKELRDLDGSQNAGALPRLLQSYLDPARRVRIGLATIVTVP